MGGGRGPRAVPQALTSSTARSRASTTPMVHPAVVDIALRCLALRASGQGRCSGGGGAPTGHPFRQRQGGQGWPHPHGPIPTTSHPWRIAGVRPCPSRAMMRATMWPLFLEPVRSQIKLGNRRVGKWWRWWGVVTPSLPNLATRGGGVGLVVTHPVITPHKTVSTGRLSSSDQKPEKVSFILLTSKIHVFLRGHSSQKKAPLPKSNDQ